MNGFDMWACSVSQKYTTNKPHYHEYIEHKY